jgi:hypothetical protein
MRAGGARVPTPRGGPTPKAGARPALVVVAGDDVVRGSVNRSGRLTVRDGQMELASEGQPALQVLFKLPDGLKAPPSQEGNGTVNILERSSAAGPDRRLVVLRDRSLILAQVWVTSAAPVTADLGDGLRLVQQAGSSSSPASALQAQMLDGDRPVGELPQLKAVEIRSRSGVFQVLVETSRTTYSPQPEQPPRYILKAWIVRAGPLSAF